MSSSIRPRLVQHGDRSPSLTPAGIEEFEVSRAIEAARLAKLNAVQDVLRDAPREELASVSLWLQALLAGRSDPARG